MLLIDWNRMAWQQTPLFPVGLYGKLNKCLQLLIGQISEEGPKLNCKGLNFQNYWTVNKWIVKYCLRILHCKVQCVLFDYYDGKVDKFNLDNLSISVYWSLKE